MDFQKLGIGKCLLESSLEFNIFCVPVIMSKKLIEFRLNSGDFQILQIVRSNFIWYDKMLSRKTNNFILKKYKLTCVINIKLVKHVTIVI